MLELNLALDQLTRARHGCDGARHAARLPRRRAGRRQDVRHARTRAAAPRARHRRRRRVTSRPTAGPTRAEQIRDLEVVPRRTLDVPRTGRSRRWTSTPSSPGKPEVALVDELAHTNVPGSRHEKRWQDVEELLDAGIDVISTVNIQHLESLNDVVERITGIKQRETVPDEVVRARRPDRARRHDARGAPPPHGPRQHLRRRQGRRRARATTSASATSPRCASWRCCGWPTASTRRCRTTASATASTGPWETQGAGGRRAHRRARRRRPHPPRRPHGHADARRARRRARRGRRRARPVRRAPARPSTASCSRSSAGATSRRSAADVAEALVRAARAENATQLVLGASRRSRWTELLRGR